jgi:hypothetical protein
MTDDIRVDANESYAEQLPPTGDPTPRDEASRAAEAPGIRQDPDGGPYAVNQDGAVVDTGSPQDYGDPNAGTEPPG